MNWIPGWDSITSANSWSNFYFWAGIIALLALGVFEVFSHRYTERKDELVAHQQNEVQRQHDEEIARLHLETAKADERATQLERENLEIRTKIAGRRITQEQHEILHSELAKSPGIFNIQSMIDGESALFASDIFQTFVGANWTIDKKEFPLGEIWTGLIIFQTDDPAALRVAEAFKAAHIPFLIGDAEHKKEKLTIMVGAKPSPF
jgi:hypothetical protein